MSRERDFNAMATVPVGYVCIPLAEYDRFKEDIRIKQSIINKMSMERTTIIRQLEKDYTDTYNRSGRNTYASCYVSTLVELLGIDFKNFQDEMEAQIKGAEEPVYDLDDFDDDIDTFLDKTSNADSDDFDDDFDVDLGDEEEDF